MTVGEKAQHLLQASHMASGVHFLLSMVGQLQPWQENQSSKI